MICRNCNKQIARPLELYNGDWACPLCKKVLNVKSVDVTVTAENDETFKLSELCYLRALKRLAEKPGAMQYDMLIETAVEYCRIAARQGNPKALVRMGYYYEYGYLTADATESMRLAYEYYRAVWSSSPAVEYKSDDPDYADNCRKLRDIAANRYLDIIKRIPGSHNGSGDLGYRDEKQKILAKGLSVTDDDMDDALGMDRISHVMGVLQSCFSSDRSPLFGIMRLSEGEFGTLRAVTDGGSKGAAKIVRFAKKITVVLFDVNDGSFKTIKTADNCNAVDGDRAYYLYFFNENGDHGISKRACAKIGKVLRKSDVFGEYARVKRLIEEMGRSVCISDYIFGEDDVLMYKSRFESYDHATDDLINSVINNVPKTGDRS